MGTVSEFLAMAPCGRDEPILQVYPGTHLGA